MHRLLFFAGMLGFAAVHVEAQESEHAQGPRILAPFKQDLAQALRDGLAQGTVQAIAACQLKAPEIADTLSRNGVRLGRTSDRLRNPSNTAPAWVVPILEAYATNPSDRAPRTVSLGDDRAGYVEPIVLQPLCLTCHGENLAPELLSRINELYPADWAVGYKVGDLRGVFWAEFPRLE